jgi:hypothetical protein
LGARESEVVMMTKANAAKSKVCTCDSTDGATKTYYVWFCTNDEKQTIDRVDEVYVTAERIYFEKRSHETVSVPRSDVFMVTCETCSPPAPCS